MTQTMDHFITDLRRLTVQWKTDITNREVQGEAELVDQIKAWIDEAERIIEAQEAKGRA